MSGWRGGGSARNALVCWVGQGPASMSTAGAPWRTAVGALATFYPDSLDPRSERQVEISVHRLIAKMITMAAYAYKHSIGQPFIYPKNELSCC